MELRDTELLSSTPSEVVQVRELRISANQPGLDIGIQPVLREAKISTLIEVQPHVPRLGRKTASTQTHLNRNALRPPQTSGKGSSAPTPDTRRGGGVGARRPLNSAWQWGAAGANPSGSRMGLSDGFRMGSN